VNAGWAFMKPSAPGEGFMNAHPGEGFMNARWFDQTGAARGRAS